MTLIGELLNEHKLTHIENVDKDGNTVFHLAMNNEKLTQKEIIEILLNSQVDPNIKNKHNVTLLQLAVKNRLKDVIDFLLPRLSDVNSVTHFFIKDEYKKFREFIDASCTMSLERKQILEAESSNFCEWLMSQGIDFDHKNEKSQSALLMAIHYNLQHILPVLLKHTKNIKFADESNKTLLHLFLETNDPTNQQQFGIDKNKYSKRYDVEIVKILLDRGVSVDVQDNCQRTPIRMAIEKKENFDIIKILLEHTLNTEHKNSEGLLRTIIWKWVHSKFADADYHMKILRILLSKNAKANPILNERDEYGNTPLMYAVKNLNFLAVQWFQEIGADFSIRASDDGGTLMHLLIESSCDCKKNFKKEDETNIIKIANLLISNGFPLNAKDSSGRTPLHTAANCKCSIYDMFMKCRMKTEIAVLLLEHGAYVNAKDNEGFTALHIAVSRAGLCLEKFIIRFLLKYGADFNARTHAGHSILRMTLWNNYNYMHMPRNVQIDPNDLPSPANCIWRGTTITTRDCIRAPSNILKHWIKLAVANLKCYTGKEYREIIMLEECKSLHVECMREKETLKNTFIDTSTSLYDFFHTNLNRRHAYLNNEKLQQFVQSPKLHKQFPVYAVLIWSSYYEAVTRQSLLQSAKEAWLPLTKIYLPDLCLEYIFSFLSNSDLFNIIEQT